MGQQLSSTLVGGLNRIVSFLPNLLAAIVVLVIGYVVARLLGAATRGVLHRARFDNFVGRHIHERVLRRSPSASVGAAVYWIIILATISMAARSLNLYALSTGINNILSYVPRALVAAILVGIGLGVGNFCARLIGTETRAWVANGTRVAIVTLTIFMALEELGVARGIVMTAFAALLGSVAVAAAIAFGFGNRELAGEYTRRFARRAELEPSRPAPETEPLGMEEEPGYKPPTQH